MIDPILQTVQLSQPLNINDLPKILTGRFCRYVFIPIESRVSEGVYARMTSTRTELEKEGFLFQRIPSASPVNEGHGLLQSILKERFMDMLDEQLLEVCKSYELWRFFSDNAVEQEEWQEVYGRLLGQIGQVARQISEEEARRKVSEGN